MFSSLYKMEAFKTTLKYIWNSLSLPCCCSVTFTDEMDSILGNNAAGGQRHVDPNVLAGKPCKSDFLLVTMY